MKRILSLICLGLPLLAGAQTTITVNTDRVTGQIDPNIYGVFMEPIGRDQEPPIENNLLPGHAPGERGRLQAAFSCEGLNQG